VFKLGLVDFELDLKIVVYNFHSTTYDVIKFGKIIVHCRRWLSSFYFNSSVEFIMQQINKVVYSLVKAAKYVVNFQIFIDIPHYIEYLLINEIL
jgi:hypothetical protein